jgi:subtilisin family serine protease
MSRTTRALPLLAVLALAVPASAPAATPQGAAARLDRAPMELPPASAARAAAVAPSWLLGARTTARAGRIARAHGAHALRLRGTWSVPAGRAAGLGRELRRAGLLRWAQSDRRLRRASAFEGDGRETGWARGAIVAPGLVPPAKGAPIGVVDDLVDTAVPDVAQARRLNAGKASVTGDHGTAVASVAAGLQDGRGVLGILPGAPLLSYGLPRDISCRDAGDGILALAGKGAKVLNISLGMEDECFYLQLAVADAFASGALVVASSGNEFANGNPVVYPAAYPHVLSVGAVDEALNPTYFSTSNAAVDLAAPGQDVPVAIPLGFDMMDGVRDGLTTEDGTSFSAPIVSGVASWVRAARPRLTAGQVGDVLRHSARDLGDPGYDSATGFGLVDLAKALSATPGPIDPYEPNDGITFVDGTAYTKPDPYIWRGGRSRTLKASVDPVEDPVDVYRVRIGARRTAVVRLTASVGNADLAVYDKSARTIRNKPVARSGRGTGRTDVVKVRNRRSRARTLYVAILAPSIASRSFDAPYALRLAARR